MSKIRQLELKRGSFFLFRAANKFEKEEERKQKNKIKLEKGKNLRGARAVRSISIVRERDGRMFSFNFLFLLRYPLMLSLG